MHWVGNIQQNFLMRRRVVHILTTVPWKVSFPAFLTAGGTECIFLWTLQPPRCCVFSNSHLWPVWPLRSREAVYNVDAVFCHEVWCIWKAFGLQSAVCLGLKNWGLITFCLSGGPSPWLWRRHISYLSAGIVTVTERGIWLLTFSGFINSAAGALRRMFHRVGRAEFWLSNCSTYSSTFKGSLF